LKKQIVKGAGGLCLCWMGLMAAVCVPSFIAGVTYTKPGGSAALAEAPVSGVEDGSPSLASGANAASQCAQAARSQTVQTHATADCPCAESCSRDASGPTTCGREIQTQETSSHTQARALGSGVKYINVTTCNK
jgi:hypothetical protein